MLPSAPINLFLNKTEMFKTLLPETVLCNYSPPSMNIYFSKISLLEAVVLAAFI